MTLVLPSCTVLTLKSKAVLLELGKIYIQPEVTGLPKLLPDAF